MISPIGEENSEVRVRSDRVMKFIIRPAVKELGYDAQRADHVAHSTLINPLVFERLKEAPLVIADLTGGNPNVMYELAIRHVLQKPVIHIKKRGDPVPFDLANLQIVEYGFDVEEADGAIQEIQECIRKIETGESYPRYTPIDLAIDLRNLQESGQPEQRSLAEILALVSDVRSGVGRLTDESRQILNLIRSDRDHSDSVYAERAEHYHKEKRYLAQQFIRFVLGPRIKHLKSKGASLQIVFDSGSTIAPMFHVLGQDAESDPNHWCRDVPVVTNNIKAVENILKYRDRPGDRYAGLPIQHFSVLPGEVLAAFEAIADKSTLEAIEEMREGKIYTIAVTTGNYMVFHGGKFLPIARGGFHPHFKATLYDIASEVYVVTPLGKILMWTGGPDDVRTLEDLRIHLNSSLVLNAQPHEKESADKPYQLAGESLVWSRGSQTRGQEEFDPVPWLKKTVLMTTSRTEQCLFCQHASRIHGAEFRADWEVGTGPYFVRSPFSALPVSPQEQFAVEIPHEN